jgi:hypothetical protein
VLFNLWSPIGYGRCIARVSFSSGAGMPAYRALFHVV